VVPVEAAFSSIAYVEARDTRGRVTQFTKAEVIHRIRGGDRFFVTSNDSASSVHLGSPMQADVMIATTRHGREFIKTRADSTHEDNLLALPTCRGCDAHARGHAFQEGHEDEDSGNAEPNSEPPDGGGPDDDA
jgi:hypothetical protein